MGEQGYKILIWDGFGSGLVMINPRIYSEGVDIYDHPKNWWSCSKDMEEDEVLHKHNLVGQENVQIIWDNIA